MYCRGCGVELLLESGFCADCGTAIDAGASFSSAHMATQYQVAENDKESAQGRWSFILGIAMFVVWIVLVTTAGILASSGNENETALFLLGLLIFIALAVNLLGFILGVVAVSKKQCKKTLAIFGLIFNVVEPLGIFGLMAIGIAAA